MMTTTPKSSSFSSEQVVCRDANLEELQVRQTNSQIKTPSSPSCPKLMYVEHWSNQAKLGCGESSLNLKRPCMCNLDCASGNLTNHHLQGHSCGKNTRRQLIISCFIHSMGFHQPGKTCYAQVQPAVYQKSKLWHSQFHLLGRRPHFLGLM